MNEKLIYIGLAAIGILGPIAFPDYIMQFAVLWIMVIMASTWDITGGQMGYNSLGNIAFFGIGQPSQMSPPVISNFYSKFILLN